MFAKIAVLGLSANAQTDPVDSSTVTNQIVTTTTGNVDSTGSMGSSTTLGSMSSSTMEGTFDHSKDLINIDVGNCSLAELSSLDTMNLFEGLKDFLNELCSVSTSLHAVEDMMGTCYVKMMVDESSAYESLMQCLITPVDMTYLETVYPVSISSVPMSPIILSPLTVGDIRDRLEAGLASDLMNDSTVVRITTEKNYTSITDSIEESLAYFNDLVVEIESILDRENSAVTNSLEIVAIEEDISGRVVLVMRPVSIDLEAEASTLQSLKDQLADPTSELNVLMGATTTSIPSLTTTSMPDVTTLDSGTATTEMEEGGSDAGLIGGLIGGIAGVAAIGGGFALWRNNKKKNEDDKPPAQSVSSPVMTPNTTHSVNGILTERTPRNTE